jgi:hypothetical protein
MDVHNIIRPVFTLTSNDTWKIVLQELAVAATGK